MKKLASSFILISALGISASAQAAASSNILFNVVVPSLKSGFRFMLEGNYLRPSNSDLSYATTTTTTSSTTDVQTTSLMPDYNFGFRVGLAYAFKHSGNDVQLNWTHFDHATTKYGSVASGAGTVVTTAEGSNITINSPTQTISPNSQATYKHEAVDLDVGQYVDLNSRLRARFFGGLRYAYLQNDATDQYVSTDSALSANNYTISQQLNASFSGIGPRLGIEGHYDMDNNFGFVARLANAWLAGNSRIVPEIDAKLGLDCIIPFQKGAYPMIVEAGYETTDYLNVFQRTYSDGSVVTSNSAISGPYVSLNLRM